MMHTANVNLTEPSMELAENISTVATTTSNLLNSSKWLNNDDVISNFRATSWLAGNNTKLSPKA
jgi:hypothetical protein